MSKNEPTPWFNPDEKPARSGVYQRLYDEGMSWESIHFCKYSDGIWFVCERTPMEAMTADCQSAFALKWRGLAKDPNKS